MFERLEVTRMAHALAAHASARQSVIANNVAHADTPGYHAREVEEFADHLRRLRTEPAAAPRLLRPPPGATLSPNGNSVSIETEMMKAVDARHRFEKALAITQSVTGIIRTSLGR